jgi:hypothetical protein
MSETRYAHEIVSETADDAPLPGRSVDTACGTYTGVGRHKRRGEKLCGPCRAANAAYTRGFRRRTGRSTSVLVPVVLVRRAAEVVPEPLATQLRSLLDPEPPPAVEDSGRTA